MDTSLLTIAEARRSLDKKEYSALELTEAHLTEIEKRNPELNAFIEVWADDARKEAQAADQKIARNEQTALTGVPIGIKDNMLIEGRISSAGSKMLANYRASYDSTVIKKLKDAGVVFIGRANMDEFALGSSTEHSAFGPSKNPYDTTRTPGGTSGGSTAAIAAHLALGAFGSDTGGSIRQPASHCGVVGMKPTYGRVSRFGLIAAASSLDQIGPIGKNVDDVETLFNVIAGHDSRDSTSLPDDFFAKRNRASKKVIGVPRNFLTKGISQDVLERFEQTLARLEKSGYSIIDVALPHLTYTLPIYYIINPAEVSSNLARFDGIRYGLSLSGKDSIDVYHKTRGSGFGAEVRRRILIGTFVLSSGYNDAYYRKAEQVRRMVRNDFEQVFELVDVVATPTTASPAFRFGEKSDPLAMYAEDLFTVPANLAGTPAISIPMGTVERDGVALPVGIQFIAPWGAEDVLFAMGKIVEKNAVQ